MISEDVTVSSNRGILPSMRCWLLCALVASVEAWTHSIAAEPSSVVPETPTRPENPPTSWVTYHLAHPGWTAPGDPNGAFFWKGRYHLHYIYEGRDGVSWAHVSSRDMIHWRWHPTTLTPATMGHGLFSGTGFLTREGRPAIIYHGSGSSSTRA